MKELQEQVRLYQQMLANANHAIVVVTVERDLLKVEYDRLKANNPKE